MTDFVLVPGAGGSGWYWHLVVAELGRRGHRAVAVDLPGPDPEQGLASYRDVIVGAGRPLGGPVVLVAQSLGGFSAPLACDRLRVERLVLVNAMVPRPGEPAGAWWDDVGWEEEARASASREGRPEPDPYDAETMFLHDVPADIAAAMQSESAVRAEAQVVFSEPWPLERWPEVPTAVLAGRDDRFFPVPLQRRVARERLGLEVTTLPGGHLMALSRPGPLVDALLG